jgi:hypothetical protein
MSNIIPECTLTDKELIEKAFDWVSKLAESGGRKWTLKVPADVNSDPDLLFCELGNRLKKYSPEFVISEGGRSATDTLNDVLFGPIPAMQYDQILQAMESYATAKVEAYLKEIDTLKRFSGLYEECAIDRDNYKNNLIGFAEFAASGFWFNNGDSDLWESFTEGEQFEVNGQMQFRFTTEELYSVYKNRSI